MSKYCFILLAFSCVVGTLRAQGTDPVQHAANMLPPSPTASELGRYGLVPMGLPTGTANISIPLHTYTSRNLSVPISLNYSSNGIKVDQIASWVGMAWSLEAGGVVTRIIRDEADSEYPMEYPSSFALTSSEGIKYLDLADSQNLFDSEVDIFTFNFMGYSGKFVFDRSGEVVVMPHQNLKIERLIHPADGGFCRITTPDGVQYTFGAPERSSSHTEGTGCGKSYEMEKESSWYLTMITHPAGDIIHFEYSDYYDYSYAANVSQNITKFLRKEINSGNTPACPNFDAKSCKTIIEVHGRRLTRMYGGFGEITFAATADRADIDDHKLNTLYVKDISGNEVKSFAFHYIFSTASASGTEDPYKINKRMFLSRLTEKDAGGHAIQQHDFEYEDINGLPKRLSYSQDHWGYYNGASNSDFVPVDKQGIVNGSGSKVFEGIGGNREPNSQYSKKGILKKITYPTGGTSELVYEANTYYGTKTIAPEPVSVSISTKGISLNVMDTKSETIFNRYTQKIVVKGSASTSDEYDPEVHEIDPMHHRYMITVFNITTAQTIINEEDRAIGEPFSMEVTLEEGNEYRFDITAVGKIMLAKLNFQYRNEPSRVVSANIETGGLRVARIVNHDPVTGNSENINYAYSKLSAPEASSGQVRPAIIYYAGSRIRQGGGVVGSYDDCLYGTLYSSSQNSLYPVNGNNIYYSHVWVSRGSDHAYGVEEHEFHVSFDVAGTPRWGVDDIISAPYSNTGWSNGLEKAVRHFKRSGKDLVKIREVVNNYVTDARNQKEVRSLVVRRKYDPFLNLEAVVPCNEQNRQEEYVRYTCITRTDDPNNPHSHYWLIGGVPLIGNGKARCIASGNNNQWKVVGRHPCYGRTDVSEVPIAYALDHLDAQEYKNIAYWHYLKSKTETTYDENGLNPVTVVTEFDYENPAHSQLSRVKITDSDGKVSQSSTKYLQDYEGIPYQADLLNRYILHLPVKIENTVADNLVEGKVTKYNDRGQALEVYQYESPVLKAPPAHQAAQLVPSVDFKLKASLTYDASFNLSEVQTSSMPVISYKWGYAGNRVVAKVTGAHAQDVYYTGFEDDGAQGNAKTGERYFDNGTYTISTSLFNSAANNLVMTYWYWQNGTWNFSGEVPFTRTITSGTRLDEIRVYPKNAQVTTITYNTRYNAIKTMTDHNNITTYYEYDDLGRLLRVRDEHNNILTEQKYHFSNND